MSLRPLETVDLYSWHSGHTVRASVDESCPLAPSHRASAHPARNLLSLVGWGVSARSCWAARVTASGALLWVQSLLVMADFADKPRAREFVEVVRKVQEAAGVIMSTVSVKIV